jgi:nanoRNase/pAp phosphatase (c-di-AMP/oligoRNAs hydrolase)
MPTKKGASAAVVAKKATRPVKAHMKRALTYTNEGQSFWVCDGGILNSLVALRDALSRMKKATYDHHVSAEKNDFADWVAVVLGDPSCADALRGAKTAAAAKTIVVRHLKEYHV